VQGIKAAEVGYSDIAFKHFTEALFIDLDNSHGNTIDGVHIASADGIWSSLVSGFTGMRDQRVTVTAASRRPPVPPPSASQSKLSAPAGA
jgi:alpha,alpha-trehalose phosphorylase